MNPTSSPPGTRIDPLDAAMISLSIFPVTPWAVHRFRDLIVRRLDKDGTIDPAIAKRVFEQYPKDGVTLPVEFLEAVRRTLKAHGIKASQPEAFCDDGNAV